MTTSLFSTAANLAGLVAMSALTLLTMLILRNPLFPKWLNGEEVAQAASLVLTAGFFIAAMNAAAGLNETNVHYGFIVIILAGIVAGSAYAFSKVFNIGDRLARADAGQSPFTRRKQTSAPPATALDSAPTGG